MTSFSKKISSAKSALSDLESSSAKLRPEVKKIENLTEAARECIIAHTEKLYNYADTIVNPTKKQLRTEIFPRYDQYFSDCMTEISKVGKAVEQFFNNDLCDFHDQIESVIEEHIEAICRAHLAPDLDDMDFSNLPDLCEDLEDYIVSEERFLALVTAPVA